MKYVRAGMLVCLVGCSASPARVADAPANDARAIDAVAIDAAAEDNVVTLATYEGVDFVAYRSGGDGPWHTLPNASRATTYTLHVADDYIVVTVCDNGGSGSAFDAEEYGFTFTGDGSSVEAGCGEPTQPQIATITGTMNQPGMVQVNGVGSSSASGPWEYTIAAPIAPDGGYSLLGVDTSNRVVLLGGAFHNGSNTGPAIDTGSAAMLVAEPLTITGLGSSQLLFDEVLVDGNVLVGGSAATAWILPSSLAAGGPGIPTSLDVLTTDDIGVRTVRSGALNGMQPRPFQLLPDFMTATIDGLTASWTTLPTSAFQEMGEIASSPDGTQTQDLTMSASWIAARDATSLAFDTSAPGYAPAWHVDVTTAQVGLYLSTFDPPTETVPGTTFSTCIGQGFTNLPSNVPRPRE